MIAERREELLRRGDALEAARAREQSGETQPVADQAAEGKEEKKINPYPFRCVMPGENGLLSVTLTSTVESDNEDDTSPHQAQMEKLSEKASQMQVELEVEEVVDEVTVETTAPVQSQPVDASDVAGVDLDNTDDNDHVSKKPRLHLEETVVETTTTVTTESPAPTKAKVGQTGDLPSPPQTAALDAKVSGHAEKDDELDAGDKEEPAQTEEVVLEKSDDDPAAGQHPAPAKGRRKSASKPAAAPTRPRSSRVTKATNLSAPSNPPVKATKTATKKAGSERQGTGGGGLVIKPPQPTKGAAGSTSKGRATKAAASTVKESAKAPRLGSTTGEPSTKKRAATDSGLPRRSQRLANMAETKG